MAREVPLVHPGVILLEEWLKPNDITQYRLAREIEVDPRRINAICNGERAITEDTALLLGAYFGVDGASFLNMQSRYDLEVAREKLAPKLNRVAGHAFHPAHA
jgi:addiction module HigA family antidote